MNIFGMNKSKDNNNNNNNKKGKTRFIEIDIIKGVAVVFMVIFHFFYLSYFMGVKEYPIDSGILKFLAKTAHTIFIIMVGVNMAVSYQANKKKKNSYDTYFGKQAKRAIFLLIAGLLVSYASYLGFGDLYVKFGIFHFIAAGIILGQIFIDNKIIAIIGAITIFLATIMVDKSSMFFYQKCQNVPMTCFITGFANVKYSSLDHFPILPYLGYICLGIALGHTFYNNMERVSPINFSENTINKIEENKISKSLALLGKNSLAIYFTHFPLFYFILKKYSNRVKISDLY